MMMMMMRLGQHFQGQKVKGQLAGSEHIVAASRTACCTWVSCIFIHFWLFWLVASWTTGHPLPIPSPRRLRPSCLWVSGLRFRDRQLVGHDIMRDWLRHYYCLGLMRSTLGWTWYNAVLCIQAWISALRYCRWIGDWCVGLVVSGDMD